MIKNSKQAAFTNEQLEKFIRDKNAFEADQGKHSDLEHQLGLDSLGGLIEELSEQLREYKLLINEGYHCFKNKTIEDISNVLIAARLSNGLSQRDLAHELGVQEQQVQRYEATDYESASLTRILEVVDALNLSIHFKDIEIFGKQPDFQIPEGISEDLIHDAEALLRINGTFNL